MYDAWDRFKDLLRRSPQHGFELSFKAHIFYNGLNYATRSMVDAAVGGSMMNNTAEEACDLYEEMPRVIIRRLLTEVLIGELQGF